MKIVSGGQRSPNRRSTSRFTVSCSGTDSESSSTSRAHAGSSTYRNALAHRGRFRRGDDTTRDHFGQRDGVSVFNQHQLVGCHIEQGGVYAMQGALEGNLAADRARADDQNISERALVHPQSIVACGPNQWRQAVGYLLHNSLSFEMQTASKSWVTFRESSIRTTAARSRPLPSGWYYRGNPSTDRNRSLRPPPPSGFATSSPAGRRHGWYRGALVGLNVVRLASALCKNEVKFFAQVDLQRFALRKIYRSLPLFLIGVRSKLPRQEIQRSPTEGAGPGSVEQVAAVDLPLPEIASCARLGDHALRPGGMETGAGRAGGRPIERWICCLWPRRGWGKCLARQNICKPISTKKLTSFLHIYDSVVVKRQQKEGRRWGPGRNLGPLVPPHTFTGHLPRLKPAASSTRRDPLP